MGTVFGWLVLILAFAGVIGLVFGIVAVVKRIGRGSRSAVCPHCGKANTEQATFCVSCGEALQRPVSERIAPQARAVSTSNPGIPCSQCGKPNPGQAKFCVGCGAPLEAAPQQSSASADGAPRQPEMTAGTGFCPKCGAPQPTGSRFCVGCGTVIQTAGQKASISQGAKSKQTMRIVAIIGAAVILIGFITPWITISGWVSADISALDWIRGWNFGGETLDRRGEVYLALMGVLLAVAGAISALVGPKAKGRWVTLVSLGGIASIIAAIWGIVDIGRGAELGVSGGYGYGVYLTLIGGLVGLVGAVASLKR